MLLVLVSSAVVWNGVLQALPLMSLGEFIPSRLTLLFGDECSDYPLTEACVVFITIAFFGPSTMIPPDDYSVIFATWPASVTSRNVIHMAQVSGGLISQQAA